MVLKKPPPCLSTIATLLVDILVVPGQYFVVFSSVQPAAQLCAVSHHTVLEVSSHRALLQSTKSSQEHKRRGEGKQHIV